jgi:hypothetical protein
MTLLCYSIWLTWSRENEHIGEQTSINMYQPKSFETTRNHSKTRSEKMGKSWETATAMAQSIVRNQHTHREEIWANQEAHTLSNWCLLFHQVFLPRTFYCNKAYRALWILGIWVGCHAFNQCRWILLLNLSNWLTNWLRILPKPKTSKPSMWQRMPMQVLGMPRGDSA